MKKHPTRLGGEQVGSLGEVKPKISPEGQVGVGMGRGADGHSREEVRMIEVCLGAWKDRGALEHIVEER